MFRLFKAGEELRDDDGTLLLTFMKDYKLTPVGTVPCADDVIMPDGSHPYIGQQIPYEVMRQFNRMLNE